MSYCVNCGVELADAQKRCPLCDTVVLNPRTYGNEVQAAPQKTYERIKGIDMDLSVIAAVASILLLIPMFVTVLCNILANKQISWSLYVVGAIVLLFLCVLFPMFFKNKKPYIFILIDCVGVFLYLALINWLCDFSWLISLALPLCFMLLVFSLFYAMTVRNKRINKLLKMSVFVLFSGLQSVAVEVTINDYLGKTMQLSWSCYVLIPCASVCLALLFINSRKKLKNELQKKLFM